MATTSQLKTELHEAELYRYQLASELFARMNAIGEAILSLCRDDKDAAQKVRSLCNNHQGNGHVFQLRLEDILANEDCVHEVRDLLKQKEQGDLES